jgi:acyl-CoA synthetase (NDP forming)
MLVATSVDEFEDLILLCTAFDGRGPGRGRIGAVSNAGFECVSMADSLGRLSLAPFGGRTSEQLTDLLQSARLDALVDVHNPLDVTPMANDAAFGAAVDVLAADEDVDIIVAGCVPLTAQLQTLPRGDGHSEDVTADDAIGQRLARTFLATRKPMVVVIDSGALYDPLAAGMTRAGVPVFRSADRALAALNSWATAAAM